MSLGEESAQDTLGVLQGKGDKFTKLSIMERKKYMDLEDAIQYVTSETEKFRNMAKAAAIEVMNVHVLTPNPAYSRADGVNIAKEAHTVTTKTLIVLEAKLNKLLQRKSEIQNQNRRLKDEINHFRLLRLQTDIAHAKFESVLAETKEKIETLLSESTKVVEERERILEKKDALERINIEEQQKFTDEYEAMGRFVRDQNNALEESLLRERKADRKGTQTVGKTVGYSSGDTPAATPAIPGAIATSDLSLAEEIEMAKKVGSLSNFIAAEQSTLSDLRKRIGAYENMFDQLKSMTGVESLEEMVSNYIAHEEEMFSLYNFIQTMNTEIDAVVESTLQTEHEISQYRTDQQDQTSSAAARSTNCRTASPARSKSPAGWMRRTRRTKRVCPRLTRRSTRCSSSCNATRWTPRAPRSTVARTKSGVLALGLRANLPCSPVKACLNPTWWIISAALSSARWTSSRSICGSSTPTRRTTMSPTSLATFLALRRQDRRHR